MHLTDLPDELLQEVLSLLLVTDVISVSGTCRALYRQSQDERLWEHFVNANLPITNKITKPGPFSSFRDLYSAHHPYWFLVRNSLWFSDSGYTGQLIIARYDNRRGVIEAFRLLAELRDESSFQWSSHPEVAIQPFNPRLHLWVDDPVIELRNPDRLCPRDRQYAPDQFKMTMASQSAGVCSSFSLTRGNLGNSPRVRNEFLWPPVTIPGDKSLRRNHELLADEKSETLQRVQNLSDDPRRISETSFYLRKWPHFGLGQPIVPRQSGDHLSIFATLDSALYTPTEAKPFQGIWIGDYSLHGCEFLLFLQRDAGAPAPLSNNARRQLRPIFEYNHNEIDLALLNDRREDAFERASLPDTQPSNDVDEAGGIKFQGRLEGIKLTGDPNIPRGELSFVAEDIGPKGLVGYSQDEEFHGARVVKSKGHIAFRNYTDGERAPLLSKSSNFCHFHNRC